MFGKLRQRFTDMKTVADLCRGAESYALSAGHQQPGSEHFLLAALDLPDGSAQKAFAQAGVNPSDLQSAIARQYADALAQAGIASSVAGAVLAASDPLPRPVIPRAAQPSSMELLRKLSGKAGLPKGAPLSGALVVAAIAQEKHSVAARALRALKIDASLLAKAALAEVARA